MEKKPQGSVQVVWVADKGTLTSPEVGIDGIPHIGVFGKWINGSRETICSVSPEETATAQDWTRANLMAASPQLLALINKAVAVLQREIVPDGISESQAITELHEIFDGPEYREAMSKVQGRV